MSTPEYYDHGFARTVITLDGVAAAEPNQIKQDDDDESSEGHQTASGNESEESEVSGTEGVDDKTPNNDSQV